MRICPDILRLTIRLTARFSAVVLAVLCGTAWAATENVWQGASQGDWDVAANWSLGHAPTAEECAVLPDTGSSYAIAVNGEFLIGALQLAPRAGVGVTAVTLTGIGFLTNDVKVADHVVGANRRLVPGAPGRALPHVLRRRPCVAAKCRQDNGGKARRQACGQPQNVWTDSHGRSPH